MDLKYWIMFGMQIGTMLAISVNKGLIYNVLG